jgi:hypothetical protein
MGNADPGKETQLSDRIAVGIATLALIVAAVTLYHPAMKAQRLDGTISRRGDGFVR